MPHSCSLATRLPANAPLPNRRGPLQQCLHDALPCPALPLFFLAAASCSASSNVLALARLERTISFYFLLRSPAPTNRVSLPWGGEDPSPATGSETQDHITHFEDLGELDKRRRRSPPRSRLGGPCTDNRSQTWRLVIGVPSLLKGFRLGLTKRRTDRTFG
ncbi:hypothetical protein CCMA1212_000763 [Trichoderma ghanense]|uniref:Uncharacterized protein n=1 Tax=Trichoderma ghanense TaxID=65468 RepID=A0ABY2HHF3_9HYPO